LYQIGGTSVAWGGIGAWLPAHDFFLCIHEIPE
jgi:hypothetical protein